MHKSLTYTPVRTVSPWPWLLLVGRTGLFVATQALVALGFYLANDPAPWQASSAWWPFTVTVTNLICLGILMAQFRAQGGSYWSNFRVHREHAKSDLLALLGVLVIAGPVSYLPNILLGNWLFGNAQVGLDLMVRPLPMWAAYAAIVLFPLTQGLVELGLYFVYVMPGLQEQGVGRGLALTLAGLALGLQHFAIPLVFDARFILWRGLMFIPFAFLVGSVLLWRPRLLTYVAVIHVLMDAAFAAMLLSVAY
jgi:hypothetical protein